MSVSIVVPRQPDGAERDRNWTWLKAHYEREFPDWEITEGHCEDPWRKGVALNRAVAASSGDILVISDADVWLPPEALRAAVEALEDASWAVLHLCVWRLTDEATLAFMDGTLTVDTLNHDHFEMRPRRAVQGGGLTVIRREAFDISGGIDPRFEIWGGEDISFGVALNTLVGPPVRFDEPMVHLWHKSLRSRRGTDEVETLAARYMAAGRDPDAMRLLIEETRELTPAI